MRWGQRGEGRGKRKKRSVERGELSVEGRKAQSEKE